MDTPTWKTMLILWYNKLLLLGRYILASVYYIGILGFFKYIYL